LTNDNVFNSRIDTPGVIERVSLLFTGNPELIQGFNTFLPMGYRIDISADPRDNMITVTTPSGITRQSTTAFAQLVPPLSNMSTPGLTPPFPGAALTALPPLGSGPGSMSPGQYALGHGAAPLEAAYSPGFAGAPSSRAAASFLESLSNRNPIEKQPAGEFNHAIQYLNKIKARYSDDPNTYKQFLEILQTYQKEQKHLQDASTLNPESENLIRSRLVDLQSQVNVQVQMLFKDAPDLLSEFKDFLPQVLDMGSTPSGSVGILPQTGGIGPGAPGSSSWGHGDGGSSSLDKAKKLIAPLRRKKRPAEKEPTPAPSARGTTNRVRALLREEDYY
jgi:paired amphipathic helix protein Sin3a